MGPFKIERKNSISQLALYHARRLKGSRNVQ